MDQNLISCCAVIYDLHYYANVLNTPPIHTSDSETENLLKLQN